MPFFRAIKDALWGGGGELDGEQLNGNELMERGQKDGEKIYQPTSTVLCLRRAIAGNMSILSSYTQLTYTISHFFVDIYRVSQFRSMSQHQRM